MERFRLIDGGRADSSLRVERPVSESLSSRRLARILSSSEEVDRWIAELEMWELGHPPNLEERSIPAVALARKMLPDPPPVRTRKWVSRHLLFDGILIEHPLVLRLTRSWLRKTLPPKVPEWWVRERSPAQIEEFLDRCRLLRELLLLRLQPEGCNRRRMRDSSLAAIPLSPRRLP